MKNDLATSIIITIIGVVAGFFICNLFIGQIDEVSIKSLDSSFSVDIENPDNELFNYEAINPTVEVYVGNNDDCQEHDSDGQCIDAGSQTTPTEENNNEDNS